jgi:Ethanolamine utilization protein EutJ (predicted chaperonin)
LIEESHIVGPREVKTLEHIAQLTRDHRLLEDTGGYFEACRIVRRQRKKILDLIGKAIVQKLGGRIPIKGGELEIVFNNVERLSTTLELEIISVLDEPKTVPVNLINKPLSE